MPEYRAGLDPNPLRAAYSCLDRLRTSLNLVNVAYAVLTPDWWLAVLSVMACGISLSVKSTAPGYWPASIFGWVLAPYVLYMLVTLVWRPVPFFEKARHEADLPQGGYEVYAFGSFDHEMQTATFLKGEPRQVVKRVRFFWGKGTAVIGENGIKLELSARGKLFTMDFWGIVEKKIGIEISHDAIEMGHATVLWKRVPAFRFRNDKAEIVAALARSQRGGSSENVKEDA